MADIGSATIAILADSKAFDRTLSNLGRQTSGALSRGTHGFVERADDLGKRFGTNLGESASRWLRRGLVAGAVGIGAAVGGVLVKGFQRFTTIEDATSSLTLLLGDATKAADLLDQTLKVVEGTPFALEDFVDATRNLVANNVKLEKVPRVLQAIADAAAASGGSAEDVNNVANSFGRMATGAQLTLGPIRELEEKGVPALRILANKWGVAAEDLAKDISGGAIDSQKAINDLTEGILEGTEGINGATVAYGGAAKNVGNTVRGAFQNMQTAIARAGANIIKVFQDGTKGGDSLVVVLNVLRETLDVVGKAGVRFAETIVNSRGFQRLISDLRGLPDFVRRVIEAFERNVSQKGFLGALADLFDSANVGGLAQLFLDRLIDGFERLPFQDIARVLTDFIIKGIAAVAENAARITLALVQALPAIVSGVAEGLIKAAADNPLDVGLFIVALGLPGVGPAIQGFFAALPFGRIVAPLIGGLSGAISAGVGALGLGAAFQILGDKIALGFVQLTLGMQTAGAALAGALTATIVVALGIGLGVVLNRMVERFLPEVNRALERFGGALFDFFADLPANIADFFSGLDWRFLGDFLGSLILNVFLGIPRLIIGAVVRWGPVIFTAIKNTLVEVPGAFVDVLIAIRDSIFAIGPQIPAAFGGVLRAIFNTLQEFGGDMFEAGANLIDSMWQGIQKGWDALLKAVGDIWKGLVDSVKRFFGIGSPSKVFMSIGGDLMRGMLAGLQNAVGSVLDFFAGLGQRILGAIGNIGDALFQTGRNALVGLRNGAASIVNDSGWGRFWQDVGASAYDAVAGALDIFSPSRRFMYLGRQMVEGLRLGVEQSIPSLDATMARLVPTTGFDPSVPTSPTARSQIVNNWTLNEVGNAQATAERVLARLAVG